MIIWNRGIISYLTFDDNNYIIRELILVCAYRYLGFVIIVNFFNYIR